MENPLIHGLSLELSPLGPVQAWSNHWRMSLWGKLPPEPWSASPAPRQLELGAEAHPCSNIRKVGLGVMVERPIWWCGSKHREGPIYALFTFLLYCFILGSQSISTMATFCLKIVEKVSLLQNELKGNHRFPCSPLDLLRGWEIGHWVCMCVCVYDSVSICEYVCLWENAWVWGFVSVCVSVNVCASVYLFVHVLNKWCEGMSI